MTTKEQMLYFLAGMGFAVAGPSRQAVREVMTSWRVAYEIEPTEVADVILEVGKEMTLQ